MLESVFERNCIQALSALPHSYWPEKVDSPSVRGLPDRVGCIQGCYIAIEFKKTKREALRKTGRVVLQRNVLEKVRLSGGWSWVVHPENWDEFYAHMEKLAKGEYYEVRNSVL